MIYSLSYLTIPLKLLDLHHTQMGRW